ncbi:MAG: XRE family transcriptional regulator [Pedobacter sp.]|nr:MAG: XRE family transcriptional regulator [Pedobacter sp.]
MKIFGDACVPKIIFLPCDLWHVKNPEAIIAFGANLRKLRELHGFSQQELADYSEISKKTIQRIENGKLNPSLDTILCLANGLKVSITKLVEYDVAFKS